MMMMMMMAFAFGGPPLCVWAGCVCCAMADRSSRLPCHVNSSFGFTQVSAFCPWSFHQMRCLITNSKSPSTAASLAKLFFFHTLNRLIDLFIYFSLSHSLGPINILLDYGSSDHDIVYSSCMDWMPFASTLQPTVCVCQKTGKRVLSRVVWWTPRMVGGNSFHSSFLSFFLYIYTELLVANQRGTPFVFHIDLITLISRAARGELGWALGS